MLWYDRLKYGFTGFRSIDVETELYWEYLDDYTGNTSEIMLFGEFTGMPEDVFNLYLTDYDAFERHCLIVEHDAKR